MKRSTTPLAVVDAIRGHLRDCVQAVGQVAGDHRRVAYCQQVALDRIEREILVLDGSIDASREVSNEP